MASFSTIILGVCVMITCLSALWTSHVVSNLHRQLEEATTDKDRLVTKVKLMEAKRNLQRECQPHFNGDGKENVVTSRSTRDDSVQFIDGYDTADSVQSAIHNGVDVRLIQDHIPLRPHVAHKLPDPVDIKLDYDTCVETIARGKGAPSLDLSVGPLPKYVHWLHLPKCGSSFGSTLYSMMCQKEWSPKTSPYTGEPCDYCGQSATKGPRWDSVLHSTIDFEAFPYCNWNVTTSTPRANFRNHVPLPLDERAQRNWLNVGLFRDPRKRLVSGWNHDKHAMGFDGEARLAFERQVLTIEDYVSHHAIRNCATKMLVGAYCARDRNLTQHVFDEAKRRLYNFAFVGLTDNFDASACLFCRMYNITPHRFMFGKKAHARPMETHTSHKLPGGGARVRKDYWKNLSVSDDPLDWEIYSIATQLFFANLQKYGLYDMNYRMLEKGIQYR